MEVSPTYAFYRFWRKSVEMGDEVEEAADGNVRYVRVVEEVYLVLSFGPDH